MRLFVDLVQQVYSRAPVPASLEHFVAAAADESGRASRASSGGDGDASDSEAFESGIAFGFQVDALVLFS